MWNWSGRVGSKSQLLLPLIEPEKLIGEFIGGQVSVHSTNRSNERPDGNLLICIYNNTCVLVGLSETNEITIVRDNYSTFVCTSWKMRLIWCTARIVITDGMYIVPIGAKGANVRSIDVFVSEKCDVIHVMWRLLLDSFRERDGNGFQFSFEFTVSLSNGVHLI
jgi:hypothetical protein